LFSVTISEQCVTSWCGVLQNMYFFMTPTWNTDLLESVGENFVVNFLKKEFPADKQFTIRWINLDQWGSQDKKQRHKCQVLNEERLGDIGVRLEHTPRKSLKRLAQETAVSKSSARTATQLNSASEILCLVCCKCKNDCCTCVFNETVNCEIYLRVERTAFSTPPVICEL
jgi:hypothetical protein